MWPTYLLSYLRTWVGARDTCVSKKKKAIIRSAPCGSDKNRNTVYVFWNLLGFDIFKNRWHPRMCGGYIKSFVVSKAVDSKAKCPAKLPVMCNDKWSRTCEIGANNVSGLWNENKALKVAEMVYLCTKLLNLTWFTHLCRLSHLSRFTRFWGDQPWP